MKCRPVIAWFVSAFLRVFRGLLLLLRTPIGRRVAAIRSAPAAPTASPARPGRRCCGLQVARPFHRLAGAGRRPVVRLRHRGFKRPLCCAAPAAEGNAGAAVAAVGAAAEAGRRSARRPSPTTSWSSATACTRTAKVRCTACGRRHGRCGNCRCPATWSTWKARRPCREPGLRRRRCGRRAVRRTDRATLDGKELDAAGLQKVLDAKWKELLAKYEEATRRKTRVRRQADRGPAAQAGPGARSGSRARRSGTSMPRWPSSATACWLRRLFSTRKRWATAPCSASTRRPASRAGGSRCSSTRGAARRSATKSSW